MSSLTKRYVRRPLYVDGVQVTEENFVAVAEWCDGEIKTLADDKTVPADQDFNPEDCYIFVRVHHPKDPKQTKAKLDSWVLYAPEQRGYKVYTPRAFEMHFDLVDLGDPEAPPEEEEAAA